MTNKRSDILWRIYLVYFLTVAFGIAILVRVVYIQFVQGDQWRELARSSTMRYMDIDAVRGDILADDGRLLATSVPVYEIRMDLSNVVVSDEVFNQGIDSLSFRLSRLFRDRSKAEYKRSLMQARRNQERYYLVKRNVNYHQLIKFRTFPVFRLGRFRGGLIVLEHNRRETPFKSLASRTIGYEREGVYVGLEGAYREHLEGIQGKRLMQRISGGNWVPVNDENEIQSQNGKDIITTLNINIQDIVENALKKQLNKYNAHHGTVVVMEVATGKVKAISNLTRNASGRYEETFNYAIGEAAEPGSTFKLASMIALLEHGVIGPDDFVHTGEGKITYYDRVMRDAKEGGYGTITATEVFAHSSNVGISKLVTENFKDKPEKFLNSLHVLGLDQSLGVEIKGEVKPYIPSPESKGWSRVTLPWMSIGYNLSLTPMQILALYNAIANEGKMMKPMFVEEIRQTGKTLRKVHPQVLNPSVCSPRTLSVVQNMLQEVVENGTASGIKSSVYKIAGKTGTAQVANIRGGYRSSDRVVYRASFAGYFPADNPEYSMIVVIHDPKGWIYTGSQVAAPVFKDIADKIYATQIQINNNYLEKPLLASYPEVVTGQINDLQAIYSVFDCKLQLGDEKVEWANARLLSNDTIVVAEREMIPNLVPNVVGMGLRDALYVLENAGMRVRFSGRGVVRTQSIRPGTRIVKGSTVVIRLT